MGLPQSSPLSPVLYSVRRKGQADLNSNDSTWVLTLTYDPCIYETASSNTLNVVASAQDRLGKKKLSQWLQETESDNNTCKAKALWHTFRNQRAGDAFSLLQYKDTVRSRSRQQSPSMWKTQPRILRDPLRKSVHRQDAGRINETQV